MFQFTHPGGVRRVELLHVVQDVKVSIHAPGRGATRMMLLPWLILSVSIHAPGRGATHASAITDSKIVSFNSRTREGCDLLHILLPPLFSRFNSRTREGCDQMRESRAHLIASFNSRTREGCDFSLSTLCTSFGSFNSRTREGCDGMVQSCVLWGG